MDKMTLRRIGWVGASLGLTSVLVGCGNMQADGEENMSGDGWATSSYVEAANGLIGLNGLNGANGLNAVNGLNAANGLHAANGLSSANGLGSANGYRTHNGLNGANGFNTANGYQDNNGLNAVNGLNVANGLNSVNGLSSANGYMTNERGRSVVQYLAKCALPSGKTLIKQDHNGTNFSFRGGMNLAPEWETGGCKKDCLERISSCMMAHINSSGTHIPLWMDSPASSVGWGRSPWFPTREGTFFGQIMLTNADNTLDAYYCNGPGADENVVPGRLGFNQENVPYSNAWPKSAGMDGLCNTNHSTGKCTPHSSGDGDESCLLNGVTWSHPITVWRGMTHQAENAEGGGFSTGTTWVRGQYGFNTACSPGTSGCAIIADAKNGMGKRVGYIGPNKGVKFSNVNVAAGGTQNLVVYYTNGDAFNQTRYLQFIVNGQAPQVRPFAGLQDWRNPHGAAISLSGFNQGSNNTIYVTADATHAAPDLDWIEVVNASSSIPQTGLCERALWTVTTNVGGSEATVDAIDNDLGDRWSTGRAMASGDYLQVDFKGLVNIDSITLNNSQTSQGDYPGAVAVYTSQDGTTFSTTPVGTANGALNRTTISFPKVNVRAIRVKVTTARSPYWSVGEIEAGCSL
jgi:hypothetical protein